MKAGGSTLLLEESGENPERENRGETQEQQMHYYVSVTQPTTSLERKPYFLTSFVVTGISLT